MRGITFTQTNLDRIESGVKRETRRIIKKQPKPVPAEVANGEDLYSIIWYSTGKSGQVQPEPIVLDLAGMKEWLTARCWYGRAGDYCFLKEQFAVIGAVHKTRSVLVEYADGVKEWHKAVHTGMHTVHELIRAGMREAHTMPEDFSRKCIRLVAVETQKLQDIASDRAALLREGFRGGVEGAGTAWFRMEWNCQYRNMAEARGALWENNPFVSVLTFDTATAEEAWKWQAERAG